jgi:hypothetical protein
VANFENAFHILHFGDSVKSRLDSPCPNSEMELVSSSYSLQLFDDVTIDGYQVLIHIMLSQFHISAFRISELQGFCEEESRLLTPPTPNIQNSEMESDQ